MSERTHHNTCELGICKLIMILILDITNPQYALKADVQENNRVVSYTPATCH